MIWNSTTKQEVNHLQQEARLYKHVVAKRSTARPTAEHVGKLISKIGEAANVVVQRAAVESGRRLKYASAHDLRRGCAERLINLGVSAETLKVIFRHSSFATTEKHYGASRSAQAAAKEVANKLADATNTALMGGNKEAPLLNPNEVAKLKALLNSL